MPEVLKYLASVAKIATSELADDEWMHENVFAIEGFHQDGGSVSKVIDPHRSVDQDHF